MKRLGAGVLGTSPKGGGIFEVFKTYSCMIVIWRSR